MSIKCGYCLQGIEHVFSDLCVSKHNQSSQDSVKRPQHYTFGPIEVIDAIEAWKLGFHLGNVVKYLARAGRKDPATRIEDLEKARWYLDRKIETLKKGDFV